MTATVERIRKSRQSVADDDAYPYTPLDAPRRQWIIAAARNDEGRLKQLMTQDASLVRTRDPTSGYTALHWAARLAFSNELKKVSFINSLINVI